MDNPFPISLIRKFILGLQGLWAGRRWSGKPGVLEAVRQIQALQLDPLLVVARSHDLALHTRVTGYSPDQLTSLLYADRLLFDYGGGLFVYPVEELPYWQVAKRNKGFEPRWARFAADNTDLLDEIRAELRQRGPLRNRDFKDRAKVSSYRARKDSGLALYYLWLTGELMTARRENFEKVYDFASRVAPPELLESATEEEALRFFSRKVLAFHGLVKLNDWKNYLSGSMEMKISREQAAARMESLLESGEAVRIRVEGWKEPVYLLAENYPILLEISNGLVPVAWQPTGTTTQEEVRFLAPLDIVSARGRAKTLFDFDYVWEVYKPAHLRRWGYYTLPVLYEDRLPARIDLKLDRSSGTLRVNGFWLEDEATARDAGFISALAAGLRELAGFVRAKLLDLSGITPQSLRQQLENKAGEIPGDGG